MNDVIKDAIRAIEDYPKPGIVFRDITPLLADGEAFKATIDAFVQRYEQKGLTKIVGMEARGFIFGTALAYALGIGFVPLRKPGKLPAATFQQRYELEYGEDALEMHTDALSADDHVLVIDDLLATGGTVLAAIALIQQSQASVEECAFVITLQDLPGAKRLQQANIPYYTLCEF
jgi:adenine phosphoribosyltransferase